MKQRSKREKWKKNEGVQEFERNGTGGFVAVIVPVVASLPPSNSSSI